MGFKDDISRSFKNGDTLTKLIYINIGIFAVVGLLNVFMLLFNINSNWLSHSLALSSKIVDVITCPWTPITYMFLHFSFIHLIFNILTLYWFGRIFLEYYSQREVVGLYLLGGLCGGAFYIIAYAVFPHFAHQYGSLCGASAAIMSIIVACACTAPERNIRLVLIGDVRIKWLALFAVVLSILNVASENAGGNISHLGGALCGFLYVHFLHKGTNITTGINTIIDKLVNLFKRERKPKMKITFNNAQRMTDQEYNYEKHRQSEQIDHILDKIKKNGYDSLSDEERNFLFSASKKR